jgi:hypothetical protein
MMRICDLHGLCDWKAGACGLAILLLLIGGCIGKHPANPAATQPVTVVDPATTQPYYWLDQPAVASVENFQFQPLWDSCERTARSYLYELDREDYRLGLLTTKPMISKQFFELWRKDAGSAHAVLQNSLQTIRRTVRFEIERTDDGTFVMTPRVLMERETILERRITSSIQYRTAFAGPPAPSREAVEAETEALPIIYWTPIGRDTAMERQIADEVRRRLKSQQSIHR